MIKFENIVLPSAEQWTAIILGARNPLNSWRRSDSYIGCDGSACNDCCNLNFGERCAEEYQNCIIGPNDLDLMKRLAASGPVHAKYRRMITVIVTITAPLYWWKEFDTYRVGVEKNSCSTMHKIADKEFTLEDFSTEHLYFDELEFFKEIIDHLNGCRTLYLASKKEENARIQKNDWWQMIQLLPSSYNQKRTVMCNYETLTNIYKSRKDHKLDEWKTFCNDWIKNLPYAELITGEKGESKK